MSLLELFCDVDDFMLSFAPQWKASQLAAGNLIIGLRTFRRRVVN